MIIVKTVEEIRNFFEFSNLNQNDKKRKPLLFSNRFLI